MGKRITQKMEAFKRLLADTIGVYGVCPDDGSYRVNLELQFRISKDAFEKLSVAEMRNRVCYELERSGRQMNEQIKKAIYRLNNGSGKTA